MSAGRGRQAARTLRQRQDVLPAGDELLGLHDDGRVRSPDALGHLPCQAALYDHSVMGPDSGLVQQPSACLRECSRPLAVRGGTIPAG